MVQEVLGGILKYAYVKSTTSDVWRGMLDSYIFKYIQLTPTFSGVASGLTRYNHMCPTAQGTAPDIAESYRNGPRISSVYTFLLLASAVPEML